MFCFAQTKQTNDHCLSHALIITLYEAGLIPSCHTLSGKLAIAA